MNKIKKSNAIYFLKFGLLYHLFIGLFLIFFYSETSAILLKVTGAFYVVFALGYLISSRFLEENWSILFMSLLEKVLLSLIGAILLIKSHFVTNTLLLFLLSSLLWIYPLYLILELITFNTHYEEESDISFRDLIKAVKTNRGENLEHLSFQEPLLLVFVRHFGCTFCRETVSEIAECENKIKAKGLMPVFVHLSDPSFGNTFFGKYFDHEVRHISDPSRALYRALNIKRGSLWQIYGFKTWFRGIIAAIFKGHGGVQGIEGDEMQLGGYFILSKGEIIFSHYNKNASEPFDLNQIKLPQIGAV